jgi:hypothetical protein
MHGALEVFFLPISEASGGQLPLQHAFSRCFPRQSTHTRARTLCTRRRLARGLRLAGRRWLAQPRRDCADARARLREDARCGIPGRTAPNPCLVAADHGRLVRRTKRGPGAAQRRGRECAYVFTLRRGNWDDAMTCACNLEAATMCHNIILGSWRRVSLPAGVGSSEEPVSCSRYRGGHRTESGQGLGEICCRCSGRSRWLTCLWCTPRP